MSWWRSFKNIYGLIMGTSTDIMKREDRPHWPTAIHQVDPGFKIQLGGTGNCGILTDGTKTLLINCGKGSSARKFFSESGADTQSENLLGEPTFQMIGTSVFSDYVGGRDLWVLDSLWTPQPLSFNNGLKTSTAVEQSMTLNFADDILHILPVEGAFSKSDLMVYLEHRKILFLGGLLFNGIHPILDEQRGKNGKLWQEVLGEVLSRWDVETIVPHEGDLCGPQAVEHFIQYLKSLADQDVEFRHCRDNFDWIEIPGQTSLEENFNHFRK